MQTCIVQSAAASDASMMPTAKSTSATGQPMWLSESHQLPDRNGIIHTILAAPPPHYPVTLPRHTKC